MHLIRRRDVENAFKHSNERTQIMFNKYNFTIHNKKNSHDMKWIKEENDIISQFERQWRFRQRVASSFSSQHKKEKNLKQVVKVSEKLSEKQKHNINY